jgi:hypothetical protein
VKASLISGRVPSLLRKTFLGEVSFQGKAVLAANNVMIFMTTQEKECCGGLCVKKLGLNGSRRIYVFNIKSGVKNIQKQSSHSNQSCRVHYNQNFSSVTYSAHGGGARTSLR